MRGQYFHFNVLFVVCLSSLYCVLTVDYEDLQRLEFQNCPLKNSCSRMGATDFYERVCECDPACRNFGDCCADSGMRLARQTRPQKCLNYGNFTHQGAYVISSCPTNYASPVEVRQQCQHDNFSDPIVSIPVTDTLNRKTYLNRYCALCNNASPTNLTTWLMSACKVYDSSTRVSWADIHYRSDANKWGVNREGRFEACDFMFDMPPSVSRIVRPCRANIVSTCHPSWTRQNYVRDCASYMTVVTDARNVAYRNPHCAMCNNVPVTELMCLSSSVFLRKSKPFSFALLLDVNRSDGDVVGSTRSASETCPNGQKYDPFFKKCRTLVCALPGYTMVDGRCVKQ
ncbi:SMB domain-containing protein [Caerostris extrusa]|uniref:SMB domain-containing protein n=1 Tax=Caerostris extrusa TaxID=172846 RepID=A0AAV4R090_CAEEX|nr:SMB domain-containing protein [Caerostris extrusa]